MSEDIAATLKNYLRSNVKDIYGDWKFPSIQVCGKSGTSQVGGGQTSNALFAGFATDPQYPLAFVCVVENGGYGATTCIPILNKVLSECKAVMAG
jgi:peptidoglycan glycosyltransferase